MLMAIEIEHKFLLSNDTWRQNVSKQFEYQQGYLTSAPTSSIRIRISDDQAWLNIKSATIGTQRHEYEYIIPLEDARELMINLCGKPFIDKTRYIVINDKNTWEIDEFHGANEGLVIAEIELSSVDEIFTKPEWLGSEVTNERRYYNNNLAVNPFTLWKND
jgi:adenylate cyclase